MRYMYGLPFVIFLNPSHFHSSCPYLCCLCVVVCLLYSCGFVVYVVVGFVAVGFPFLFFLYLFFTIPIVGPSTMMYIIFAILVIGSQTLLCNHSRSLPTRLSGRFLLFLFSIKFYIQREDNWIIFQSLFLLIYISHTYSFKKKKKLLVDDN